MTSGNERLRQLEAEVQQLRAELAEARKQNRELQEAETLVLTLAETGKPVEPRSERILLVEDHPFDRKVMRMMLSSLGYSADHAANGAEALTALEKGGYDIVLMDVQMPQLDGIETTRRIRERWPGTTGPRIIALTARSLKGDREACLAAGMDDYISKPVPLRVLAEKLEGKQAPLVDERQIERYAQLLGAPALGRLIDSFVSHLPVAIGNLQRAQEAGRGEVLAGDAAALKAAAEVLGIRRVARAADAIERLAGTGEWAKAAVLVSFIECLHTPLARELSALRGRFAPGAKSAPHT